MCVCVWGNLLKCDGTGKLMNSMSKLGNEKLNLSLCRHVLGVHRKAQRLQEVETSVQIAVLTVCITGQRLLGLTYIHVYWHDRREFGGSLYALLARGCSGPHIYMYIGMTE